MAQGPELMLASPSSSPPSELLKQTQREGNWWAELKFDGIRAVIDRDIHGRVRIYNRRRIDITHRYPDVVEDMSVARCVGVIDGEIVVMRNDRPSFSAVHLRDAQSTPARIRSLIVAYRAVFVPFDVLESDGVDRRGLTYVDRHELLVSLVGPQVSLSTLDSATLWQFVSDHQLEGLILKRGDSAYRPGRQRAWVKVKATRRISALVGDLVTGKAALELFLFDPDAGRLISIGSVGSGLRQGDLTAISERLRQGESTVVEVEYLEVSESGQLRMPVFKGIRHDVDPNDVVVSTLI